MKPGLKRMLKFAGLFRVSRLRSVIAFGICILALAEGRQAGFTQNQRSLAVITQPSGFQEVLVASGLDTPSAMEFAPDSRLFVAEKGGALRVIQNGQLLPTPFLQPMCRLTENGVCLGSPLTLLLLPTNLCTS